MYCTVHIKANDEIWAADRKVNDAEDERPMAEQLTDNFQIKLITIVCATHAEVVRIKRQLQDDPEWHHDVTENVRPIHEGLNLFVGEMSAKRYLSIKQQQRDDGEYIANADL